MSELTPKWYYANASRERIGPLNEQNLKTLLQSGQLSLETLVWCEGMPNWQSAKTIPALHGEVSKRNQFAASSSFLESDHVPMAIEYTQVAENSPRPWVRYWANGLSYGIYYFIFLGITTSLQSVFGQRTPITSLGTLLALLFLWVGYMPIDAWLITKYGGNVGHLFFKTRVENLDGSRLSYIEALRRTARLWLFGLGLHLPLINIVTMILSCKDLNAQGQSVWDRKGGHLVTTDPTLNNMAVTIRVASYTVASFVIAFTLAFIQAIWKHMHT